MRAGASEHAADPGLLVELASSGFAHLKNLAAGTSSIEIANRLGVVDAVEGLAPVQSLIPRAAADSPPNT